MSYKLLISLIMIIDFTHICCSKFEPQKNMFQALSQNNGVFDFGFAFLYVGEEPFEFEYYLFIGQHFWRVHKTKDNEREVCIDDLESDQHIDFDKKYSLAFSYLSDHMVEHNEELNLTNHVLLVHHEKSNRLHDKYDTNEVSEWIFDANHDNLDYLLGADFYVFTIPGFKPSVAFQPQSFTDDPETEGPNFVFIQQNKSETGFERRIEIHSIIDGTIIRNRTEQYAKYIPPFINGIDNQLYINAILPSRLGPEGVNGGIPAVILIVLDEGLIKYCVTEEKTVDESCKPLNLKQLLRCDSQREEL